MDTTNNYNANFYDKSSEDKMRNKLTRLIFILFINLFISSYSISEEINFEANSIELIDKIEE